MRSRSSPLPHFSHFSPVGMPALYDSISPSARSRSSSKRFQNPFTESRQGSLPSSISSNSSSRRAVKPTSKMSSKLFTSRVLTFSPSIVGVKIFGARPPAFRDAWQRARLRIVLRVLVLLGGLINGQIAVKFHHRTGGAECVVRGRDVNRGLVEDRRHHLRSHE